MKSFPAFLSALLIVASTSVGALGYDPAGFPGKGSEKDYWKSVKPANKAKRLIDEGRYQEAVETYDKAIAIYPLDAAMHSNKGIALSELGDHTQAISEFRKAMQLEPSYAAPINNLADEFKLLKDYKNAEIMCKKASALDPRNPIPLVTLGEICVETKRYPQAQQYFSNAKKLAPGDRQEAAIYASIKAGLAKIPRGAK